MTPLMGYLGMVGFFLAHAVARASYDTGKEHCREVEVIKEKRIYRKEPLRYDNLLQVSPEMTVNVIDITQDMEEYHCFNHMDAMHYMSKDEENYWKREVKESMEECVFRDMKKFMVFEEIEDERGEPPFRYKTFRTSILVGTKNA